MCRPCTTTTGSFRASPPHPSMSVAPLMTLIGPLSASLRNSWDFTRVLRLAVRQAHLRSEAFHRLDELRVSRGVDRAGPCGRRRVIECVERTLDVLTRHVARDEYE